MAKTALNSDPKPSPPVPKQQTKRKKLRKEVSSAAEQRRVKAVEEQMRALQEEIRQVRQHNETQELQLDTLKGKKAALQQKEAEETKQLEMMVQKVEANLDTMGNRKKRAEAKMLEVQLQLNEEQQRLAALRQSNALGSAGLSLPLGEPLWGWTEELDQSELERAVAKARGDSGRLVKRTQQAIALAEQHLAVFAEDLKTLQELSHYADSIGRLH